MRANVVYVRPHVYTAIFVVGVFTDLLSLSPQRHRFHRFHRQYRWLQSPQRRRSHRFHYQYRWLKSQHCRLHHY